MGTEPRGSRALFKLSELTEDGIAEIGAALGESGDGAASMEEAAGRIVGHLYEGLTHDRYHAKGCALVRFYKTHTYRALDADSQVFARRLLGAATVDEDMRCLALLASVGENPDWNDRTRSRGHRAIPLPDEDFVESVPMIWRMIRQFGLETRQILRPDPAQLAEMYDVFHVEDAVGSPYIPAQEDFVVPYGVRSVVGFGGMLDGGDLFVVILFAKVRVSQTVAERFPALALDVRRALARFAEGPVFADSTK